MHLKSTIAWAALGEPPWAPAAIPTAPLPSSCDVAIVGGGVTGLSAALELASRGRHVVVLDRHLGHGAATRSGGIVVGDTLVGPAPGFARCEHDLRAWIDANAVRCGLDWRGCWEMDRDDRLAPAPVDWQDEGAIRVSRTVDGGTLDPARLVEGLARLAASRGAMLVSDVEVERWRADAGRVRVTGPAADILARQVLVAVDATSHSGASDRWPVRKLTIALATTPIGDDLASAIGWRTRLPFYTNDLPLLWGRALDDGAMIVGRELIDLDEVAAQTDFEIRRAIEEAGKRLLARARRLHPALASIDAARVWAGPIARDASGIPSLTPDSEVPGVWWAGGYGGHGLAQAFRLGAEWARGRIHPATH